MFVTFNLHGAARELRLPPGGQLSSGEAFAVIDRRWDGARKGPLHLNRPAVAKVVVDAIHAGARVGHYELHAYVVMPNHVHLLVTPKMDPSKLLQAIKGVSAREANKVLGSTGEPFWQKESYDHWVRDEAEFRRISRYIEENPVRAGLCGAGEGFAWSSAGVEMSLDAAR